MKESLFRKTLVFGVICLFIGFGVWNINVSSNEPVFNTIYVDDDNTEGPWDGSQAHPYQHIQDAIDNASDGDTIYVYSGTYYENVVVNKTINLFGEDRNNTIIDGGGNGDVISVSAHWVNFINFTMVNSGRRWKNDSGIEIQSDHNNVSYCIIKDCNDGIRLVNCKDNTISMCRIYSNFHNGIVISYASKNNIHNCEIWNHTQMRGIFVERGSTHNFIIGCTISCNYWGIQTYSASSNTISNCSICTNNPYGIHITYGSNENLIKKCDICGNYYGIYITDPGLNSTGNKIYHNYFKDNQIDALDGIGSNQWDNGYPDGGNHWESYDESSEGANDNKHGFNQDITGSDGIVDNPHWIELGFAMDAYPLHKNLFTDKKPPNVSIIYPQENGYYFVGNKVGFLESEEIILLGPISVEVHAFDFETGIRRVELYMDGKLEIEIADTIYSDNIFFLEWKNDLSPPRYVDVTAVAYDNAGNVAATDALKVKFYNGIFLSHMWEEINAPFTPHQPEGPTEGRRGEIYEYCCYLTRDRQGDKIFYQFSFGGLRQSDWIEPFPFSLKVCHTQVWFLKGTYDVKVRAKDEHGHISSWSAPLTVVIS